MEIQKICPICDSVNSTLMHNMTIKDNYPILNERIEKTNNSIRNYILFENILKRSTSEVNVDFKLCENCGFIYFSPRPNDIDLKFKYDFIKKSNETYDREQAYKLVDMKKLRAKKIYKKVVPHIKKKSGRILDIGGADGHCMTFFTDHYSCEILDYENRDLIPGVKKIGETLNDLKKADVFDLVLTCHTLEHIPDIVTFIKSMSNHLSKNGIVYIEVPFGCSNEIKKTFNLLTHINFFSEGSLGYLLNKEGLAVKDIYSGPILSSKRYLPVIVAIATITGDATENQKYIKKGFSITKTQMKINLDYKVFYKNIFLVLSHPIQYLKAILGKLRARFLVNH